MAVVVVHAVASIDGYIADTDDEVGIWSWCHIDRSRTGGTRMRRVTSSMTWRRAGPRHISTARLAVLAAAQRFVLG